MKVKRVLLALLLFIFVLVCACQPVSEQAKPSGEGGSSQRSESVSEAENVSSDTGSEASGQSRLPENERAQLSENEMAQIEGYFQKNLTQWLEQERPLLDADQYGEPCDYTLIGVLAFEATNETANMKQTDVYKGYGDTLKAVTADVILMPNNETTAQLAMALGADPDVERLRAGFPDAQIPEGAFRLSKVGFIAQGGSDWVCELTATGF